MTTVSSVITDALRESNLIAVGKSPTAAEEAEGLQRLQVIVSSVLGNEAGENLSPLALSNDLDYIPANRRVMLSQEAVETRDLDPNPSDGARLGVVDVAQNLAVYPLTLDGNGRTIEGSTAVTLSENALRREWFYRADLGDWVRVTDLEIDGDMPFPREFDDLFILMLAMRLNPRYGQQMSNESGIMLRRAQTQFRARYHQAFEATSELALRRLTGDRIYPYTFDFDTGKIDG